MLTRVRVDARRPRVRATPTKPIGPFYDERAARRARGRARLGRRARRRAAAGGASCRARSRVEIVELAQIARCSRRGVLVIAAGGGGIPVVRARRRACPASTAVIDKDRASAELAIALGADLLVLLTGVARVALDFGTRWQRDMARLTVSDALRRCSRGEFPPGSMGPKIESARARSSATAAGRAVITRRACTIAVARRRRGHADRARRRGAVGGRAAAAVPA